MSVRSEKSADGNEVVIGVSGRFDYSVHQDFRKAYEQAAGGNTRYVLDLDKTEYLDSSALGMLLLLREYAGGTRADVRIVNCREGIMKILNTANFQKLFSIQ